MIAVKQEITSFLSSNITQLYNDWVSTTTYIYEDISVPTINSVVRYNGYYWRSLTANNIGNNPELTEGINWFKWEVSNRYAMLDQKSLTRSTIIGSDIIVEFLRGNIDSLGLGYIEGSGVKIEHYDSLNNIISEATQEVLYSTNDTVYDLWSHIYDEYSVSLDRGVYYTIPPIGYKIKLTIYKNTSTNIASCGYLFGGEGFNMGSTLDKVNFSYNSFSLSETDVFGSLNIVKRNVQDLVDFNTIIEKSDTPRFKRKIKQIYDDILMFVIEDEGNEFENMITLGKVSNASIVAEVSNKNMIAWSIMESI